MHQITENCNCLHFCIFLNRSGSILPFPAFGKCNISKGHIFTNIGDVHILKRIYSGQRYGVGYNTFINSRNRYGLCFPGVAGILKLGQAIANNIIGRSGRYGIAVIINIYNSACSIAISCRSGEINAGHIICKEYRLACRKRKCSQGDRSIGIYCYRRGIVQKSHTV